MKKSPTHLPTISKQEFQKKLRKNKNEDDQTLSFVRNYFQKRRKYLFRIPAPKQPVILLVSGGIDSIVAWAILLERFDLVVYPVHVSKKRNDPQIRSIRFFSDFFQKRYPQNFRSPFFAHEGFTASLQLLKKPQGFHPQTFLDVLEAQKEQNLLPTDFPFIGGVNMLAAFSALLYSQSLFLTQRQKIQAIFCGVTARDGEMVKAQTLTYMRSLLLNMSLFVGDTTLQYSSLFFETETDVYLEKNQIMKLGDKLHLPLEKTYSCYKGKRFHCGQCLACITRQAEFHTAGIKDMTLYLDNWWDVLHNLKQKVKKVL